MSEGTTPGVAIVPPSTLISTMDRFLFSGCNPYCRPWTPHPVDDHDDVIGMAPVVVAPELAVIATPSVPTGHNDSPSHVSENETQPDPTSRSMVAVEAIASIGASSRDQAAESVSPAEAFSTSTTA